MMVDFLTACYNYSLVPWGTREFKLVESYSEEKGNSLKQESPGFGTDECHTYDNEGVGNVHPYVVF